MIFRVSTPFSLLKILKQAELAQSFHEPAGFIQNPIQDGPSNLQKQAMDDRKLKNDHEVFLSDLTSDLSVTEVLKQNLWEEAYAQLRNENPKLIQAYERDLLASQDRDLLKGILNFISRSATLIRI